MQYLLVT